MPYRFNLSAQSDPAEPRSSLRTIVTALTLFAAPFAPPPAAQTQAPPPSEIFPLEEVRGGLEGTLTTVLQGTERETLALEIVGMQEDGIGPGLPIILCRLTDERGRFTGVASGMSGSPVEVDGRLVGALSYSIGAFTREPLCGITPIESMLELESLPSGVAVGGGAQPAGMTRIPSLVAASGLGPGAADALRETLAEALPDATFRVAAQGAEAAEVDDRTPLEPGDPIAALLVWGDVRLGAVGTVTWREGDRFLAFGHPYVGLGKAAFPAARAEVVWTVASDFGSYKISNVGEPFGVVTQDRLTGILGELDAELPRGLPLDVTVRRPGRPETRSSVSIIEDRYFAPGLAGLVVQQLGYGGVALEREEALAMRATVELEDGRSVSFGAIDSGAAGGVRQNFAGVLGARIAALMSPPIEVPRIARIDVTIDVEEQDGGWTLASALPDRLAPRAGDTIRVRTVLEGPSGTTRSEEIDLEIPETARAGSYVLLTGSSLALEGELGAIGVAERRTARNVDDLLAGLAQHGDPSRLETRLVESAEGIVTRGRAYPALPGTAHALLRARPGGEEAYRSRWLEHAASGIDLDRTVTKLVKTPIRILPADDRR